MKQKGTASATDQLAKSQSEAVRNAKKTVNATLTARNVKRVGGWSVEAHSTDVGGGMKFWAATVSCDWEEK